MDWAIDTLSEAFGFNLRAIIKITKNPHEWRHKYRNQTIQTFGLDEENVVEKLGGLGFAGKKGLCGMVLADEVVEKKPLSDEAIKHREETMDILLDTVFRAPKNTEPWKLDWQILAITYNPWTVKNDIADVYIKPHINESREKLMKYGKQTRYLPDYKGVGLFIMLNNFLINNFLEDKKWKVKWENIHSKNDKVLRKALTIDLGMTGFIENAIYNEALESVDLVVDAHKLYPKPIAVSFGVDYAYQKDDMVLAIMGYTAKYEKEVHYDEMVFPADDIRTKDKVYKNSFIANQFIIKIVNFLSKMKMPTHICYTVMVDGHSAGFRETLIKARNLFWEKNTKQTRYSLTIQLSEKPKIIDQINDERNLFYCGKVVFDKNRCAQSLQEYANLCWKGETAVATLGADDCINARWYGREKYKVKIMKGVYQND